MIVLSFIRCAIFHSYSKYRKHGSGYVLANLEQFHFTQTHVSWIRHVDIGIICIRNRIRKEKNHYAELHISISCACVWMTGTLRGFITGCKTLWHFSLISRLCIVDFSELIFFIEPRNSLGNENSHTSDHSNLKVCILHIIPDPNWVQVWVTEGEASLRLLQFRMKKMNRGFCLSCG